LLIFPYAIRAAAGKAECGDFRSVVVRVSHNTTIFAGPGFSGRLFFAILNP
jgi:hypothetical protein